MARLCVRDAMHAHHQVIINGCGRKDELGIEYLQQVIMHELILENPNLLLIYFRVRENKTISIHLNVNPLTQVFKSVCVD